MSTNEAVESGLGDEDYIGMLIRPLASEITVDRIISFPMTDVAYFADSCDYSCYINELHKKRTVRALGHVSASFEFYYTLHDKGFIGGHSQD